MMWYMTRNEEIVDMLKSALMITWAAWLLIIFLLYIDVHVPATCAFADAGIQAVIVAAINRLS